MKRFNPVFNAANGSIMFHEAPTGAWVPWHAVRRAIAKIEAAGECAHVGNPDYAKGLAEALELLGAPEKPLREPISFKSPGKKTRTKR